MKPLGHKAYGSIPHLPSIKRGPGDHGLEEEQAALLTGARTLPGLEVYVQEKLDGSCMSVAKIGGMIVALGRAGYLAESAPFEHCQLFAPWVAARAARFDALLSEGERVVGEWMLMATAIRYWIPEPDALFVAFDIMRGHERATPREVESRCAQLGLRSSRIVYGGAVEPEDVYHMVRIRPTFAAEAEPEGLIYRAVRDGKVSFLGKWTRGDFDPGRYLGQDVYNYPPQWLRPATSEAA